MIELVNLIVDRLKLDSDIIAEIPENQIYAYQHPAKGAKFPLIVVMVDDEDWMTTELDVSCFNLEFHVLTQQNNTGQLARVRKRIIELVANQSFLDSVLSVNYICQLEGTFHIDTREMMITPAPVGAVIAFKVLAGSEV